MSAVQREALEADRRAEAELLAYETEWQAVWRRFRRHRMALVAAVVLSLIALSAIFAPLIAPYPPDHLDLSAILASPSAAHPLGTDQLGRDVLSRLLYAGRVSLAVGVSAAFIAMVLGTLVGSISGYLGGVTDTLLMRFVDVMLSVPTLFLIIDAESFFQVNAVMLTALIGFTSWMGVSRLVRGQFLALKSREFVEAARAEGARGWRIVTHHLLPNALAPVIVNGTLSVGVAIITESALSFLGFGIQPPTASWGNMLSQFQNVIYQQPTLVLYPGIMIFLTVLCVNLIGDGLRDALDPRLRI